MPVADKKVNVPKEIIGGKQPRRWLRSFWPLGVLIILAGGVIYSFGGFLFRFDDFLKIVMQARALSMPHDILFLVGFVLVFTLLIALSLPVALFFTFCAGFLFGWGEGALIGVLAKTVGSFLLFWLVRYSFAGSALRYGGERLVRIDAYIRENAFSCLLFLRLQPVIPFFLVNLAAALCGMRRRVFLVATVIGVTPAACIYSFSGASLAGIVEKNHVLFDLCAQSHQPSCEQIVSRVEIWTPQVSLALLLLALLTLAPLLLRQKPWFQGKIRDL